MTFIKSHLILGTLFFALVGATMAVSATCAKAGPKGGGIFSDVSGLDLGSGR